MKDKKECKINKEQMANASKLKKINLDNTTDVSGGTQSSDTCYWCHTELKNGICPRCSFIN